MEGKGFDIMTFNIIKDYEEFKGLKIQWNDLLDRMERPEIFYLHEWADCYISKYAPKCKDQLSVLIGYDKDKLVTVFPFLVVGEGTITFISTQLTDYNLVYVDNSYNRYELVKKAIEYLLAEMKVSRFDLEEIPQSSELFILQRVLEKNGFSVFLKGSNSCSVIPRGGWNSKVNKSKLKDAQRRERRLLEKNSVDIESSSDFDEMAYSFIAEQKKAMFGVDSMGEDRSSGFYRSIAVDIGDRFSISTLKVDEKLVASHMGFKAFGKFYYYIPAYDREMSKSGVGTILLKHLVEDNNAELEFDFLRGDEDYKFDWCDNVKSNFNLYAYRRDCSRLKILKERVKASKKVRELLGK